MLIALRRVIRATDLHSKHLAKTIGLTGPQILLLQTVQHHSDATISKLADEMSLSQPTVTNILGRLEGRGYLYRERSQQDRRKVHVHLSDKGAVALRDAPVPLQDRFTEQFDQLQAWEQSMIIAALQRVAQMMDAQDIDAAPLLIVGNVQADESSEPPIDSNK
ncbi:DNA-binding MarR family transcriptional regulator [Arenicella xantha]|uniref:DNA-binding MarR family transcriptional regulator n=1 Tax=Arenicella xantha TaxID=644221 RepID=A0A395JIR6_9GAMM|nr:DNA-binding MarR family transcriptional regulator [Arenicella xantha]